MNDPKNASVRDAYLQIEVDLLMFGRQPFISILSVPEDDVGPYAALPEAYVFGVTEDDAYEYLPLKDTISKISLPYGSLHILSFSDHFLIQHMGDSIVRDEVSTSYLLWFDGI